MTKTEHALALIRQAATRGLTCRAAAQAAADATGLGIFAEGPLTDDHSAGKAYARSHSRIERRALFEFWKKRNGRFVQMLRREFVAGFSE